MKAQNRHRPNMSDCDIQGVINTPASLFDEILIMYILYQSLFFEWNIELYVNVPGIET